MLSCFTILSLQYLFSGYLYATQNIFVNYWLLVLDDFKYYNRAKQQVISFMSSSWYAEGVSVLFLPWRMFPWKWTWRSPFWTFVELQLICHVCVGVFHAFTCLFSVKPVSTEDALESLSAGFVSAPPPSAPKKTELVSNVIENQEMNMHHIDLVFVYVRL